MKKAPKPSGHRRRGSSRHHDPRETTPEALFHEPGTRHTQSRETIENSRDKVSFVFCFSEGSYLIPLEGGRGVYIFYSPDDYLVEESRQRFLGRREDYAGEVDMIGGTDITIPTLAGATALDFCLRVILEEWPHAVFEDAITGRQCSMTTNPSRSAILRRCSSSRIER